MKAGGAPGFGADAIDGRLREAGRLAGSLRPAHRLDAKLDLGGVGVAARLREASELLELCRALRRAGAPASAPTG
ncbi:MAG TPA: hypothetical protein VGP07_02145 [Polyangia bacterium]